MDSARAASEKRGAAKATSARPSASVEVTVECAGLDATLDLSGGRGGGQAESISWVTGFVTDTGGQPLADATVTLVPTALNPAGPGSNDR